MTKYYKEQSSGIVKNKTSWRKVHKNVDELIWSGKLIEVLWDDIDNQYKWVDEFSRFINNRLYRTKSNYKG